MKLAGRLFATVFGVGFFPKAPGTAASVVAALLYVFALHRLPWPLYILFLALLFFLGSRAARLYAEETGEADPQRVVIDEAMGQFLALFLMPNRWLPVLAAFLLFRFFDIIKPGPIRRLEKLSGGWGIMADDAVAGAAAGALVHLVLLAVAGLTGS
jgi:phosphatidylglycerophosphatase A